MVQRYSVDDILPLLKGDYHIVGNRAGASFWRLCSIFDSRPGSLTWLASSTKNKLELLDAMDASIVICDKSVAVPDDLCRRICLVSVDDPMITFVRIGNRLFPRAITYGTHSSATIHPAAQVHARTSIGPYAYVGAGSIVGEGTVIRGHAHLCDDADIRVGRNVEIHEGCTIGVDGFGFIRADGGDYENFPQVGGVVIEDDVVIHAHTNVDRGTLGNTIVGAGTKIDKFCHIGHNVVIGRHCIITAHSMLGGSARIGDHVGIAPCVCVRDGGVRIGSRAFVGMATVVTKDVPEDAVIMGFPGRPIEEYKRLLDAWRSALR